MKKKLHKSKVFGKQLDEIWLLVHFLWRFVLLNPAVMSKLEVPQEHA